MLNREHVHRARKSAQTVSNTPENDRNSSGTVCHSINSPRAQKCQHSTNKASPGNHSNPLKSPFSCVCDVNIAAGGRLYINAIAVLPRDYHRENLQTRAKLMHRHCRPNAGYKGQGDGADLFHSVIIGDICWIAANATTLSGVAPDDHSL
ncbi:hypothetical protein KL944_004232 [Ogataea haglerorum]|nr:hypothetical protein KL944_004232 [Ogataea haglerorum]